jgi:regulator of sigma E protease
MKMRTADGNIYTTTVVPKLDEESGSYMLGVAGGYIASDGVGMDIKYAGLELRYWVKATVSSLKMLVTGQVKGTDVMGPVGVSSAFGEVIDEVKESSSNTKEQVINILLNMLNWSILLSVNLGIMNLLPVPALDGGRFLFLLIEVVRRKKIPADKEAIVNLIGFALVIVLMVFVFANDIKNVFFN